jgi:branched-chain amino acid transport system substrate-binding protein
MAGLLALAVLGATAQPSLAEPGGSDTSIILGQTMPYNGPVSAYGNFGRTEQATDTIDPPRPARPADCGRE